MSATVMRVQFLLVVFLLGGCATLPMGPSVMVLPGTGKSFDQFRYDDLMCRDFALGQVGGVSPSQSATQSEVASAVAGTALGAAAGAVIGGERGAAVGAGTGLLVGTMAGSEAALGSAYYTQQWYDNAYLQCMYANGHLVPMSGRGYMGSRYEDEGAGEMPPSRPRRVRPSS